MIERFIRCRECNQILPLSPFCEDFAASGSLPGVEWSNEDSNFLRKFTFSHWNHPQEEIWVDPETIFSEKSSHGTAQTIYFEATNGHQKFLIKRTKPGLAHPARYEILPGRMKISNQVTKIQEADLRKEISAEGSPAGLSAEKTSEFIRAFSEEVAAILPQDLLQEIDALAEGDSPRVLYAALKEERWEKILDRCARNFQILELRWIREFIRTHRQPGEVLSLVIHRKVSFLTDDSTTPAKHEKFILHP
jgi:hypothetical protein